MPALDAVRGPVLRAGRRVAAKPAQRKLKKNVGWRDALTGAGSCLLRIWCVATWAQLVCS
jgi:hypothetical protein